MELLEARNEITDIDREIVRLLEKRFDIVVQIGKYKKEHNLPVYDGQREKIVVENCIGSLKNKKYFKNIEAVFTQIMTTSKEIEK